MTGNIDTISNGIKETTTGAAQSADVANELSKQAVVLQEMVRQFKL
ncbi:MAG: hypothetical protein HY279_05950 [Nitrospinae bacterium]|nr:hypothetical protein [Nitrospinota bacterium]